MKIRKGVALLLLGVLCLLLNGCAEDGELWRTDTLQGICYSAPNNWTLQEGGNYKSYGGVDGAILLVTALEGEQQDLNTAYQNFTSTMVEKEEVSREELTVAGQQALSCTVQHKSDRTELASGVVLFELDGTTYIFALTCKEKSFEKYDEIYQTIITSIAPETGVQK